MKTRDVRVRTRPRRRKVPIFHAESGGAEFKAYKRTAWSENPNAFAGFAGAPFRDNQNAECALTATRLDIVEKLSNRFKHGMLLRRACAMWDADARRTARYIDLSMISCVYKHLRLESCVSVVAPYCTLRERHSGYIN